MGKRHTTITVDQDLIERAKDSGINISKAARRGIKMELNELSGIEKAQEMASRLERIEDELENKQQEKELIKQKSLEYFDTEDPREVIEDQGSSVERKAREIIEEYLIDNPQRNRFLPINGQNKADCIRNILDTWDVRIEEITGYTNKTRQKDFAREVVDYFENNKEEFL